MVLLNVKQMLKDKGKTKYWLFHQLDCISYTNFNNMIEQKTNSIKYENIEKLCDILECEPQDLFTIIKP